MCNNTNTNQECRCIAEILKTINILQDNAECCDSCLDTCDRGFLGCSLTPVRCNTRPVMLYTCCGNGTPWTMPTTKDDVVCGDVGVICSNVFRIEKIDGCCATFRVLVPNTEDTQGESDFTSTNTFFTMNLTCVCALRCLNDTFVCI